MVNCRKYFGSDDHDCALRSSCSNGLARLAILHKSLVCLPCNLANFCHCNGSALLSLASQQSLSAGSFFRLPKRESGQTCKRLCLRPWLELSKCGWYGGSLSGWAQRLL